MRSRARSVFSSASVKSSVNQPVIAGRHEVGLDHVRAVLDRLAVRRERVFGAQRARAAMADHLDLRGNWLRGIARQIVATAARGEQERGGTGERGVAQGGRAL